MSFIEFIHPDYHESSKKAAANLAMGNPVSEFENIIVRKDGTTIPMVWSAKWDEATQLMYAVARDATERKRAEAAADEVRRRYERIFQDAPAFICALSSQITNPDQIDFEFQMVNQAFGRIFRKKDLTGKQLLDVFPEIASSEIGSIIQQVYLTGSTFEASEMPIDLNIGENDATLQKYLSFVLSADKAHDGTVKGVFLFGIDVTEQVENRNKIQYANERYAIVSRATFDAVWDWNVHNDTIDWGEGFESVFGHTLTNRQSELSFWSDLVHPDDEELVHVSLREAQESESGIWMAEYRFKKADGTYAHVVDRGAVIKDDQGRQLRMVGAMQDVSAARQLEKLLTRTSKMALIGAWELYPTTGQITFSEVLVEILEIPSGVTFDLEALRNLFLNAPMQNSFAECLLNAIDKGESWDEEIQINTFTGRTIWVRSKGEAEMTNGSCNAIYASIQDIDRTKTTQIELADAYVEKEDILESIGDAFFAIDAQGRVTYWNRMAEKLSGVKREELIGRDFITAYPFELDKKYFEMAEKLEKFRQTLNFESYNTRQNIWLEFTAYPSVKGISVYFRDITARKIAEENLIALNERLQNQSVALIKSNKELEQFAYVASHDLQEPLRMISGFLSQLEKKYASELDEQAHKYISYAVDGASRMRTIILDLLDYSRAGIEMKVAQDIDLNKLIQDIIVLNKKNIEATGAVIQYKDLPTIKAYKSPMMQIFQNLIGNSLKYAHSSRPAEISIQSFEEEEYYHFTISDNGIGINPDYFERIFEMFQRLHSREKYPGTGMGLALTKKIIENMGGRIWVESEEDKGSTFHFTLRKQ
jgi:PAS domain S-box-containing protein